MTNRLQSSGTVSPVAPPNISVRMDWINPSLREPACYYAASEAASLVLPKAILLATQPPPAAPSPPPLLLSGRDVSPRREQFSFGHRDVRSAGLCRFRLRTCRIRISIVDLFTVLREYL